MLTVILAALLGVLGIVAVLAYVHKANVRAIQGVTAVPVLVAQQAIPAGTPVTKALRDHLLERQMLPQSSVPADAVHSVTSDISGLVTSYALPSGQLLLRTMLVTRAQVTSSGAFLIPPGDMAVTVELCLAADVAGYVKPSSYVALFDTYSTSADQPVEETCNNSHQAPTLNSAFTRIVLPKVEVLSITSSRSASATTGTSTTLTAGPVTSDGAVLVTLAVSQAEAEKLILAGQTGLPYLALLTSTSDTKPDSAGQPLYNKKP
jgi:pilus assembly protein CpaB